MEVHRGRLVDHVHLRVHDFDASLRFYRAALEAVGRSVVEGVDHEGARFFSSDELWVTAGPRPTTGLHLAFQAVDREVVHRFHAAVIEAGGVDNGGPGERAYHPGYYAAFAFDPDGNNVEAVYHGPGERSADSVVIKVG